MKYFLDLITFLYGERQNFNDSADKMTSRHVIHPADYMVKVFPNERPFDMTSRWLRWTCSKCPKLCSHYQRGSNKIASLSYDGSQCLYTANNWAQHEHRSSPAAFSLFITWQQRNTRPKKDHYWQFTNNIIGSLPLFSVKDSKAFAVCHLATLLWRSKVCLHHLVWNESAWWHKT